MTMRLTATRLLGALLAIVLPGSALAAPEVKSKLAAQGLFPVGHCGASYAAFLRKQYEDYGRGIREANIKPEG